MPRWMIALAFAMGCRASVPTPARAVPPAPTVAAPDVNAPAPAPAVLEPFTWERVLVVGNGGRIDGPGLAAQSQPGDRVAVRAVDGTRRDTTIDTVDRDACGDDKECPAAWIASEEEEEQQQSVTFPGRPEPLGEDIALIAPLLAVPGRTVLPDPVPHALEVRYFDALCEGDDDGRFVLLARTTSTTPHPLEGAPALARFRGQPQRVVTVRVAGRSLHFVTAAAVAMPKRRRMTDLRRSRREAFFVFAGDGADARVLHEETHTSDRTTNHDFACQLPVRYPIPWTVVAVEDEVFVLTLSALQHYDRWLLTDTDLQRVGEWTADVFELF